MSGSKSALAGLWGLVKNLVTIAVLGWVAWYAYSLWNPAPSGVADPEQDSKFNCQKALAERESDDACLQSESCTMAPDELNEMKYRQADIDQHCNLTVNPLSDAVL